MNFNLYTYEILYYNLIWFIKKYLQSFILIAKNTFSFLLFTKNDVNQDELSAWLNQNTDLSLG